MSAFLTNFDPYRHDVLYGLQASRETYVFAYIKKTYEAESEQEKQKYDLPDADDGYPEDYASDIYTKIEKEGTYINSYNEPITSGDFSDVDDILLAKPSNSALPSNPLPDEIHGGAGRRRDAAFPGKGR
jgi:hypothetical protein